jgi:hypothetical protein
MRNESNSNGRPQSPEFVNDGKIIGRMTATASAREDQKVQLWLQAALLKKKAAILCHSTCSFVQILNSKTQISANRNNRVQAL